jgi:hypothetical protein
MSTNEDDKIMKNDTHLQGSANLEDNDVNIKSLVRDIEFEDDDLQLPNEAESDLLDEFEDIFGKVDDKSQIEEISNDPVEEETLNSDLSVNELEINQESARKQLDELGSHVDIEEGEDVFTESTVDKIVDIIKSNLVNILGGTTAIIFVFLIVTKDIGGPSTGNLVTEDGFSEAFDVDWDEEELETKKIIKLPAIPVVSAEEIRLKAEQAKFSEQQAEFARMQAEFKERNEARERKFNSAASPKKPAQITNLDLTQIKPKTVTAATPESYNYANQESGINETKNLSVSEFQQNMSDSVPNKIKRANTVDDFSRINRSNEPLTVNINQPRTPEMQQNSLELQNLIDQIETQNRAQEQTRIADEEFKKKLRKGLANIQTNFETIKNKIDTQDIKLSNLTANINAISKKVDSNEKSIAEKPKVKTIKTRKVSVAIARPSYRVLSKKASQGKAWVISNRTGDIVTLFEGEVLIGWGKITRITDNRIITTSGVVIEK